MMPPENWTAQVRRNTTNLLRVAIVLVFLLLAAWAISLNHFNRVIAAHEPWLWLTTALVSVGPELAGIVIGVVTIDYLNERRQTEQLKAQLIRQMGSNIRDVAVPAARELAHHGWLEDGSLSGASLTWANLEGADLRRANLSGTDFENATLTGATLWKANLNGANLEKTNLSGVNLGGANLSGSNLSGADLRGSNLSGTNLEDANLSVVSWQDYRWFANLSGAYNWTIEQLEQVKTLEVAVMPDGVLLKGKVFQVKGIEGPTLEDWKAQYLAKNGGTVTDIRNEQ